MEKGRMIREPVIRIIPGAKRKRVSIDTVKGGWTSHRGVRFSGDLIRNEGRPSLSPSQVSFEKSQSKIKKKK